jgi:hypothetical protein
MGFGVPTPGTKVEARHDRLTGPARPRLRAGLERLITSFGGADVYLATVARVSTATRTGLAR